MIDSKTPIATESYDKAQRKLDAQRAKLAALAQGDENRADEQRVLDLLEQNAQMAGLADLLQDGSDHDR